ncbi:uncharacterized protein LOC126741265 [Anthonomus grandis grandis]|uniref:uncharacterized protein LOC126741265 n=1 Tax=Anthonomus grandis grandis TaxID=2921223 RepID=UPI002165234C|nr:uncharacterized protein LOC126741265 [Anthonomus grandis grandis]
MISPVFALIFGVLVSQPAFGLPSKITDVDDWCVVTEFDEVAKAVKNCTNIILDSVQVPGGETLKLHLNEGTQLIFRGEIVFGYAVWAGPLVEINGTNVYIEGEGAVLNGQGELYWDGKGEWGSLKPKFFTLQLHNSVMTFINVLNSPVHCVQLADSTDVELSFWTIDNWAGMPEVAGADKCGHNTDGFDIWNGTNIRLTTNMVFNQDDCVAIRCGNNIFVDQMSCFGGHGLSISVGFSNESVQQNTLSNVIVSDSVIQNGENGIHIKTHVDGGLGSITNVTYKNILIREVTKYGINVQQNYRNQPANSSQPSDAKNNIPITNLTFDNIFGLVQESAVPIYINCAEDGCFDWTFNDVNVTGTKSNNCNFQPAGFTC